MLRREEDEATVVVLEEGVNEGSKSLVTREAEEEVREEAVGAEREGVTHLQTPDTDKTQCVIVFKGMQYKQKAT